MWADRKQIKADRNDLSFVKIEVVDTNGLLVQEDLAKIKLSISGNGELIASGNANPCDMESVNHTDIYTYKRMTQAVIRPNSSKGIVTLKATANRLKDGDVKIEKK